VTILDARMSKSVEGGPSFSLRNRLTRAAWNLTWFLLASWTPPPMRGWRRLLLRLFGAHIAPTSWVYGSVQIWLPANLRLGEYAVIGRGATVYNMSLIALGDYAVVSQGAHLCTGTHDIEDPNFQLKSRPITIGSRAWVAADAFVGPGVSVGEGAVLGARGCTFKDLDAWTVYIGNPAQPQRKRNLRAPQLPSELKPPRTLVHP
jgi:putative colanic acid biosynthesis acetyltransferase WcaF